MADAIRCDVCTKLSDAYPRFHIEKFDQFYIRSDRVRLDVCSTWCIAEYARRQNSDIAEPVITITDDPAQLAEAREDLRFTLTSLRLLDPYAKTDKTLLSDSIRRIEGVVGRLTEVVAPDEDEEPEP